MKWFEGIDNLKDLRKMRKQLAKKYHPDCGGDTKTMQSINAEYDKVCEMLMYPSFENINYADVDIEDMDFTYTANNTDFDDSEFTSAYYNDWANSADTDDSEFETVEDNIFDWAANFMNIAERFGNSHLNANLNQTQKDMWSEKNFAYHLPSEKLSWYWHDKTKDFQKYSRGSCEKIHLAKFISGIIRLSSILDERGCRK